MSRFSYSARLAIGVGLALVAATAGTATAASAATLEVEASKLPPAANGARYELYTAGKSGDHLVGRLDFTDEGSARVPLRTTLKNGDKLKISIEAARDRNRRSDGPTVLHGTVKDGAATLAFPINLATPAGEAVLATPTDNDVNTTNDHSGVWYPSLGLPKLPDGWRYEGWARTQGTLVSTGRFADPAGRDSANPFSGTFTNPPIPGEDLLFNLPSSITKPVNLADGSSRVAITVEPDINGVDPTGSSPYPVAPLALDIPSGQATGTRFALTANTDAAPTATVTVHQTRATERPRYTGYATVSPVNGSHTVGYVWRGRQGWKPTNIAAGTQAYIYPFAQDWRWGWVAGHGWTALTAPDLTLNR